MKTFIYGAGKNGMNIAKRLNYIYKVKVNGFLDTYKSGIVDAYGEIVPINDVKEDDAVIISIQDQEIVLDIYYLLKSNDIHNIYWWHDGKYYENGQDFLKKECSYLGNWGGDGIPACRVSYC